MKKAFTLLELIFVIVVLGIVASLGAQIIVNSYESYILQRAQHRASVKTELAALQIANRLASAIPGTVIRKLTPAATETESITSPMLLDPSGNAYKVLQWVGADSDSFSATATPGWSGFCDVDVSSQTNIETPGSDMINTTQPIINNLAQVGGNAALPWIYFPYDTTGYDAAYSDADSITLTGAVAVPPRIVEQYKLAWTSYALVVQNNPASGTLSLYLVYNFQPTVGAAIPANANQQSLLMNDITTFKFTGSGRTIRFKICKEEEIGDGTALRIPSCKEKAVF